MKAAPINKAEAIHKIEEVQKIQNDVKTELTLSDFIQSMKNV